MRQLFFLLSILLFLSMTAQAQSKKAKELYLQSYDKVLFKDYEKAKELLKKAIKIDDKYTRAYVQLADVHEKLEEYEEAKSCYQSILKYETKHAYRPLLKLGDIELFTDNMDAAINYYQKAIAISNIPAEKKAYANKQLANAEFIKEAMKNPVPFNPINLGEGINSTFDEYLPALTADEEQLIFTRRFDSMIAPNEDFYISEKKDSVWQTAVEIEGEINSPNQEGSICITPDGKKRFFAAKDRWNTLGSFDLYYTYKVNGVWVLPRNMEEPTNTTAWESQPSISADGTELYFSSNRPGGKGGRDIWMIKLIKNYWSAPINLGDQINTGGEEQCPFIHPDGQTLYFSSDGHVGMGDTDIFKVQRDEDGNWGKPVNLGYPINNKFNQSSLVVSTNGKRAYFTSENGENGLDIYQFDLPKEAKPKRVTYVKGIIKDAQTKEVLSADIEIIDLQKNKLYNKVVSDAENGEFLVTLPYGRNFLYNVAKDGYLFFSESYQLRDVEPNESYELIVELEPINVGKSVVMKNIFFESGSFDLKPESHIELDKLYDLLSENPNIKIEITGHTDNVGQAATNLELSNNRAKSVADYLISKGIAANRTSFKGMGDQVPIADNDTDAGRAMNRRTEFKVTGN